MAASDRLPQRLRCEQATGAREQRLVVTVSGRATTKRVGVSTAATTLTRSPILRGHRAVLSAPVHMRDGYARPVTDAGWVRSVATAGGRGAGPGYGPAR